MDTEYQPYIEIRSARVIHTVPVNLDCSVLPRVCVGVCLGGLVGVVGVGW